MFAPSGRHIPPENRSYRIVSDRLAAGHPIFSDCTRAHLRNVPHLLDSYGGSTVVTQEIQRARH